MNTEKLLVILAEMKVEFGVPYALMVHRTQPKIPFITYFFMRSDNFIADNHVYIEDCSIGIQILSDKKEFALETALKSKLNLARIPWEQMPDNYDSDKQEFITQFNI